MSECYFEPVTGLTPETVDNMVRGPGLYFYNVDEGPLNDAAETDPYANAIANAIKGGATRGGNSFTEEIDQRDVAVDGVLGPTMGLQAINTRTGILTLRPLEHIHQNVTRAMASIDTIDVGNGLIKYQPRTCIRPEDYLANAMLAAKVGAGAWALFVVDNARVTDGFGAELPENDEVPLEIALRSHYSSSAPSTVPYRMYYMATVPTFLIEIDTTTPLTVAQGATLSLTINATRVNSYEQSFVAASLISSGNGLSAGAWTEEITDPSTGGTLELTAAADAAIGKQTITVNVRGADGKVSTAAATVTVTA